MPSTKLTRFSWLSNTGSSPGASSDTSESSCEEGELESWLAENNFHPDDVFDDSFGKAVLEAVGQYSRLASACVPRAGKSITRLCSNRACLALFFCSLPENS